jgi:Domain of Unknown Function (DUF1206)
MPTSKAKRNFVCYLPIYGCISTGLIYTSIGVIAILSFLKIRHGGADESSMMAILNDYVAGKILVCVILLGSVSYIVWRIYESITDPYGYGNSLTGKAKRHGVALSTVADMLIIYAAVQVLFGFGNIQLDGQPEEERRMVKDLLLKSWGSTAIITIGCIVITTAVIQFMYGILRGYKERIDIDHFNTYIKNTIHVLAWAGYTARGIILGITGFFLIKAGALRQSKYVVNTDKAFDFIGDNVGHFYFIVVALGTICYGLFMFALSATYDADRD